MKAIWLNILVVLTSFSGLMGQERIVSSFDSLARQSNLKPDSVVLKLKSSSDSVQSRVNGKLDSIVSAFNSSIAHLNAIPDNSSDLYLKKLDSAYLSFQNSTLSRVRKEYDSVGQSVHENISKLNTTISSKRKMLDSLRLKLGSIGIANNVNPNVKIETGLPDFQFGKGSIPGVDKMNKPNFPNLESKTLTTMNNPGRLTSFQLPAIEGLDKLKTVQSYSSKINEVTTKVNKVKGVNGKINKKEVLNTAQAEIENKATNIKEIRKLKEQNQVMENLEKKSDELKNVDAKAVRAKAKQEFVDHFAGKEALLQSDMTKIANVQLKYRDIADARFLPKRPPNDLKGKPLSERLVPGITWQFYRFDKTQLDLCPFIAYRITRKTRIGLSGFQRFVFREKNNPFIIDVINVVGIRSFANFRLFNKVNTYLEYEWARFPSDGTSNPSKTTVPEKNYYWKDKLNLGLTKNFRLSKRLTGSLIAMQNVLVAREIFNPKQTSIRFGVEYKIKKK